VLNFKPNTLRYKQHFLNNNDEFVDYILTAYNLCEHYKKPYEDVSIAEMRWDFKEYFQAIANRKNIYEQKEFEKSKLKNKRGLKR
jgi:hypothetical protein